MCVTRDPFGRKQNPQSQKLLVGHHYHSTYSNFARGVSILVLKTLPFKLLDLILDPDGRFVLVHALIHNLPWVLVGLYLLSLASLKFLNLISAKLAQFPSDNVVLMGDFNLVPDSGMDRCAIVGTTRQGLVAWADRYGPTDVWRWRNLQTRTFTCHSATHTSFLSINLAYVVAPVLPRVWDITILPRGISDHAPLLLSLELATAPSDRLWRLFRFWVSDTEVESQIHDTLRQFWRDNPGAATENSVWEAFKASSRGHYQSIIVAVRKQRRAELTGVEAEATRQEALYVRSHDPQHYTQQAFFLRTSLTQKKQLTNPSASLSRGEDGAPPGLAVQRAIRSDDHCTDPWLGQDPPLHPRTSTSALLPTTNSFIVPG